MGWKGTVGIIWDSLKEKKGFISLLGISGLTESEAKSGGLGYIMEDEELINGKAVKAISSKVIAGGDTVFVTPSAKELSRLF